MINAKEARRVCDKARIPPSKLEFSDLIKNISDKIELAAAAGWGKIELSFTSAGIWRSDIKSADLEKFLKERGMALGLSQTVRIATQSLLFHGERI